MRGGGSPGVAVGHLCLRFGRARLEFVKVRQLFPVVVLVLVGVVVVGAHDVISHTVVRLLWPRNPEEQEWEELKVSRGEANSRFNAGGTDLTTRNQGSGNSIDSPIGFFLIQVAQRICFGDYSTCFQR